MRLSNLYFPYSEFRYYVIQDMHLLLVKVTQTDVKVFFEQLCGEVSLTFFLYLPIDCIFITICMVSKKMNLEIE